VVKWIWVAVVVVAVIVLIGSFVPVLGRLSGLRRAAAKLQRQRAEAMKLQESVAVLEQSLLAVQHRAEGARRVAAIAAGFGPLLGPSLLAVLRRAEAAQQRAAARNAGLDRRAGDG
jgi:hypothetical protein